jgi:hypothetical protein
VNDSATASDTNNTKRRLNSNIPQGVKRSWRTSQNSLLDIFGISRAKSLLSLERVWPQLLFA